MTEQETIEQETMKVWLGQFENSNAMVNDKGTPLEIYCMSCTLEDMALESVYLQNEADVYGYLESAAHGGFIPKQVLQGTCQGCGFNF